MSPRVWLLAVIFLGCGKSKGKDWVEERQKASDEAKEKIKADHEKEIAPASGPSKAEPAPKDSYWDDPTLIRVDTDMKCPDGFWALFPGKAPGTEKAEVKQNEAQRAGLVKKYRAARFISYMKPPNDVKLLDYDAPKGHYPVNVAGLVDCQDSAGHLSILFTDGKAITPGASAAKKNAEVTLRIWEAKPYEFFLPMASMGEAKEWKSKHMFDLEGRVVYKLGKAEVDKKTFKTSKQSSAGITMGGGDEDWGAGRAVRTQIEGVRLTTDKGRTVLEDTRKK